MPIRSLFHNCIQDFRRRWLHNMQNEKHCINHGYVKRPELSVPIILLASLRYEENHISQTNLEEKGYYKTI